MKKIVIYIVYLLAFCILSDALSAGQTLVAKRIDTPPVIDGTGNDPAWKKAQGIVTHDRVADIDIVLKSVYTDKEIFFLVSFPDLDESIIHKSWVWDKIREIYKMGNDREDIFIFKWNMDEILVDLSIYSDDVYKADIWYWKACRTNRTGFADDKMHILGSGKTEDSTKLTSVSGQTIYLLRKADSGKAAFNTTLKVEYEGDALPRYNIEKPSGSRADVKAKGVWQEGVWTIEFARVLNTGNPDDIQFDLKNRYQFGISRFEIAGREINPDLSQPLYGCGDISEELILNFKE